MPAERTNARRSRQATNNPPPSLRRQDAVIHETVIDRVDWQVVDFGIHTEQVNDILRSLFGEPVQRPRREVVRSNPPPYPRPVRASRRRNPEEVDTLPLYTKLPGAGETTVDISPSKQSEVLPEYSEAEKDEDESKSQGKNKGSGPGESDV